MIYDVTKLGSAYDPPPIQGWSQRFGDYLPAGNTQFTERRQLNAASAALSSGAFYAMYTSDSDSGDTYLQGGTVTGGNGGSATIPDYKVIDDGGLPAGRSDGDVLYLRVACTATVEDNIMLPGVAIDGNPAYTLLMADAEVPDPHVFTVDDPTGYIYTEIGRWTATGFLPSMPGNILASGCIGNFNLSRV